MHPVIDWGDPHTLRTFIHHVTGADYRGRMFFGLTTLTQQWRFALWRISTDFLWIGLIPVALGALLLIRKMWQIGILTGLFIFTGLFFAINYRIPDIDSYLLTATFGLALLFLAGFARLSDRFRLRVVLTCGLALALTNCALQWRQCDESSPSIAEAFLRDLLGPLPPRSLLFTTIWGQAVSPAYYFQTVENVRTDVTVIAVELTRVSWYLDELERRDSALVFRAEPSFHRYRDMLRMVEHGEPYDSRSMELARRRFLTALADGSMPYRPVFSTGALPEHGGKGSRVPYHLAVWLRPDSAYVSEPAWSYRLPARHGRIDMDVAMTCQAYAEARILRALYESAHGRSAAVSRILSSASAFDPHIHVEDIGPMPLNNEEVILNVAAYFRRLATGLAKT